VNCAGETGTIGSGTLNSILYATLGIANACPAGN
jgi:hypothetical protein